MNDILEQELAKLSQDEKVDLLGKLWDSLDADSVAQPMSDELFAELERRAKWADEHPDASITMEQLAQQLYVRL